MSYLSISIFTFDFSHALVLEVSHRVLLSSLLKGVPPDFPQVGALCQPHGACEGFPWPVPEEEAYGDRDQWVGAEHGAGKDHRLDSQGLASPQPLPGGSQLLRRHHW